MSVLKKRIAKYFQVNEDGSDLNSATVEGVQKDYVAPNLNNEILNQRHGTLLTDEGMDYITLVVSQNEFLRRMTTKMVIGSKCSIPINEGAAKFVQVADGVDPFDTSGNLGSYYEVGYDLVLQTVKLCYRITEEDVRAMSKVPNWVNKVSEMMARAQGNELLKVALTACPASGDNDLKNGYHWNGTAYASAPYIGMTGLLYHMKHGYTYTKDGGSVTVSPAGLVDTYDSTGSKFRSLLDIFDDMILAYPSEWMNEGELSFFCSKVDQIKYRMLRRDEKVVGETGYETMSANRHAGIEIVAVPFLKNYDAKVTKTTDFFPGQMWLGSIKDLIIAANMDMVEERFRYDQMKMVYDTMYVTQLNFGTIPQRIVVAYKGAGA